MDEYSPKRHDIAQFKFLCENLFEESMVILNHSNYNWFNKPTSKINVQLKDLIKHIASFTINYKIKYVEDKELIMQTNEYINNTFVLFSSYVIGTQDIKRWQQSSRRLFKLFAENGAFLQQTNYLLLTFE